MKKSTTKFFSKLLAQYGTLTSAILGISEANGQIVYTDIDDDGGFQTYYRLDLDNNGQADFIIDHNTPFLKFSPVQYYVGPGNAVSAYAIYPNVGVLDDVISSGNPSWNSNYVNMFLNAKSCTFSFPLWCDITDGYLKLRFLIGSETHYGWARLDVGISGLSWTIKDYAYNMTPDAPILAGQTTSVSIDDNTVLNIKIVSLHKSNGVYNLKESANYRLLNMTGQEVLKGETSNSDYVIEASTLASGVYIVELGDTNTNTVIRKKVVLQ